MNEVAAETNAPPDWEAIEEDIRCPLCDYRLRGLAEARCPECGYRFDWPDLVDPTRRLHPTLFEHHSERNWTSFRQTLLGGLRPRRFWTSLHPVQPSSPRRLVLYWFLAALPMLTMPLAQTALAAMRIARYNASQRALFTPRGGLNAGTLYLANKTAQYGSLQAFLDAEHPTNLAVVAWCLLKDEYYLPAVLLPPAVVLAWPWISFAALLLFAMSMHRARVNNIHVLRCVLYCFDVVLWIGLWQILATVLAVVYLSLWQPTSFGVGVEISSVIVAMLMLSFGAYRLWMAYRLYMRFDHALAVVFASQVIALLVTLILFLRPIQLSY